MNALRCACGRAAYIFVGNDIKTARGYAALGGWSTGWKRRNDEYEVIDICPTCTKEGSAV